ncbi:MAG: response regulator [Planctomycetes bacterium]|nr:response regulator [Planctomycetota bacterium]
MSEPPHSPAADGDPDRAADAAAGRDLREFARALLDSSEVRVPPMASDDISRLAQELQVAYAELQVQFRQIQDTQRRLAASEARYRTLFEDAPNGNLIVDQHGYVVAVNRTLARWLDRRTLDLAEQPFVAFLAGASQSAFAAYVQSLARRGPAPAAAAARADLPADADGEDADEIEIVCRVRGGASFPASLRGRPLPPDEDGGSARFLLTLGDLRRRHQLEERLRQSQKLEALGILAGGIAHDFNNTLQIIRGYGELLLSGEVDAASRTEMLRAILVATERARQITSQIQMFSRRRILRPEVVDLGASVRETLQLLRPLLGDDVVTVLELSGEPLPVRVDAGQLGQVVMNLAANARDAMPEGGEIRIDVRAVDVDGVRAARLPGLSPGTYARMEFSDRGCGIRPEDLSRIFDPFFSTKDDSRGSGLGLATVYGIVRRAGGAIDVQSEVGRGTRFELLLPLTSERASGDTDGASGGLPAGGERLPSRVLLVDDSAGVREVAARMLRGAGVDVVEAGDPEEALALVEGAARIDLVITDVVMPVMNGFQLVDAMRAQRPELPALFVSGYTREEIFARGGAADSAVIVPKPFSSADLLEGIARVMQSAETAR